MLSMSTPAGVSRKLVVSTPVEVSTTSTSMLSGVSSNKLLASASVELSTTGGGDGGVVAASGAGGRGADGGLDLQKKFLAPRALNSRPRVERGC